MSDYVLGNIYVQYCGTEDTNLRIQAGPRRVKTLKRSRNFGPILRIRRARAHAGLQLFFADIADHDDHDNAGGAGLCSSVYTTPDLATGRAEILPGPEQAAPPPAGRPHRPYPVDAESGYRPHGTTP